VNWLKIHTRVLLQGDLTEEYRIETEDVLIARKNTIWIRGGCAEVRVLMEIAEQELSDDACS
jgi:hypothetical protein